MSTVQGKLTLVSDESPLIPIIGGPVRITMLKKEGGGDGGAFNATVKMFELINGELVEALDKTNEVTFVNSTSDIYQLYGGDTIMFKLTQAEVNLIIHYKVSQG